MLNDEICKLRDKLNSSIERGDDYSITYQLSIELDELIARYYKEPKDNKKNWRLAWHKLLEKIVKPKELKFFRYFCGLILLF